MQICIEIGCTTIGTLHKLIHKLLTRSVQNSCNFLEVLKPVFKIGFFSLILIASLKRRIFQFLNILNDDQLFLCSFALNLYGTFLDLVRHQQSSTILSENSDGVNLTILNICRTPLHSLRWMLTTLSLPFQACSTFF